MSGDSWFLTVSSALDILEACLHWDSGYSSLFILYRSFKLYGPLTLCCLPVTIQCLFTGGPGDAGSPSPPDRVRSSCHLLAIIAGTLLSLSAWLLPSLCPQGLLPADVLLLLHTAPVLNQIVVLLLSSVAMRVV